MNIRQAENRKKKQTKDEGIRTREINKYGRL